MAERKKWLKEKNGFMVPAKLFLENILTNVKTLNSAFRRARKLLRDF